MKIKDMEYVVEIKDDNATNEEKNPNESKWFNPLIIAAILVLLVILAFLLFTITKNSSFFSLKNSSGNIHIHYINKIPKAQYDKRLLNLTEDELFNKYDTIIFKGKIEKIKNIEISFNGDMEYNSIATIMVSEVYQGDIKKGDKIDILVPCPINGNCNIEDTDTAASMKEGMTGIFMPVKYDETSIWEENKESLCLLDIAKYGFLDGERYAFLDNDNSKGLIFDKRAYPSIKNATTLNDVEKYIKKMIK